MLCVLLYVREIGFARFISSSKPDVSGGCEYRKKYLESGEITSFSLDWDYDTGM